MPKGTFVADDHWQYTFLCKGCLNDAATAFNKGADTDKLGYAFSTTPPATIASKGSALNFHAAGFGAFDAALGAAKSDAYGDWVKLAG